MLKNSDGGVWLLEVKAEKSDFWKKRIGSIVPGRIDREVWFLEEEDEGYGLWKKWSRGMIAARRVRVGMVPGIIGWEVWFLQEESVA